MTTSSEFTIFESLAVPNFLAFRAAMYTCRSNASNVLKVVKRLFFGEVAGSALIAVISVKFLPNLPAMVMPAVMGTLATGYILAKDWFRRGKCKSRRLSLKRIQ